MFFLSLLLALNCFGTNSVVRYNKLDETLTFEATPSPNLLILESQMCSQQVGSLFTLTVVLGGSKFVAERQKFSMDQQTSIQVPCKVEDQNRCDFAAVKDVQYAMFEMDFIGNEIILSGTVGKLQFRWFDRTKCHNDGNIYYMIDGQNTYIRFNVFPRSSCEVVPINDELQLIWSINGEVYNAVNETLSSFSAARAGFSTFRTTNDYIYNFREYTISCAGLQADALQKCIARVKGYVKDQLASVGLLFKTRYEVATIDPATNLQITRDFYQEVITYFQYLLVDIDDGCFKESENWVMIFDDSMRRRSQVGSLNNCSHKVFSRMAPYDSIRAEYCFSDTLDFSNEKYRHTVYYDQFELPYAQNIDTFISCDDDKDPEACKENLNRIRNMKTHACATMTHFFQYEGDDFVNAIAYSLVWEDPPVMYVHAFFMDGQVCLITSEVSEALLSHVVLTVELESRSVRFEADLKFVPGETVYCHGLTGAQMGQAAALEQAPVDQLTSTIEVDSYKIPISRLEFFFASLNISYLWVSVAVSVAFFYATIGTLRKLRGLCFGQQQASS